MKECSEEWGLIINIYLTFQGKTLNQEIGQGLPLKVSPGLVYDIQLTKLDGPISPFRWRVRVVEVSFGVDNLFVLECHDLESIS